MSASSITVRDLTYAYPGTDHHVLNGVDLEVAAGERVAILGPNGSGKTTLMLHFNGLLSPAAGSVAVGDTTLTPDSLAEVRRRVGLVFQDPNDQLFMHTVRDDVAFGPANLGMGEAQRDERVRTALSSVDAAHLGERAPHHLSGGEKRRIAVATVLAMQPEVLVLDEPTSNLDPVGRRELAELLATLPQTQVIVTHDLPFALATCDRSVVLDGGRIVVDRATPDLLDDEQLLAQHRLELPFGYRS